MLIRNATVNKIEESNAGNATSFRSVHVSWIDAKEKHQSARITLRDAMATNCPFKVGDVIDVDVDFSISYTSKGWSSTSLWVRSFTRGNDLDENLVYQGTSSPGITVEKSSPRIADEKSSPSMTSEKYSPKITINERLIAGELTDTQRINGKITAIDGCKEPAIEGCKKGNKYAETPLFEIW